MESTPLFIELIASLAVIAGTIGVVAFALGYMYIKSKKKNEENE
jgi:hypothetical protein